MFMCSSDDEDIFVREDEDENVDPLLDVEIENK